MTPKTTVAIVTPDKKQNEVIKLKNGSFIEIIIPAKRRAAPFIMRGGKAKE